MKTYQVTVTREGNWWMVHIPEIDGLTQARRLGEAPLMAREYIAASVGADLEDVEVDLRIDAVGEVTGIAGRLKAIEEQRARAKELVDRAAAEASSLAKELAEEIPLRDVGAVLGVSYQRVHQLVHS
ncbi:hypothetical protein ATK36_4212 [Amycolatopsis sulphurea]|uniref:HicB family toxin-antitoxin system n=1 Tax=Amycolatopsis sulphurea TaxID=76022 RepID=A0A2A9FCD1_9PSEU|nr:HicB family toxin-antitoxin system [Amycolatopsis sulphurea]PFG49087.1 hypothetical protein ATK36_4212 [Amycolatopsis sulphurea]